MYYKKSQKMKRSYKNTINNVAYLLLKNIIINVYYCYAMY